MRSVLIATRFMVISLEVQALDIHMPVITPVEISGLIKIIILIIIFDMQLFYLSILQVELKDVVFLFILLVFWTVLRGIQRN